MKVAVITPYHKEPRAWLERCLASVRAQTVPVTHIVVADGHPQAWIDGVPGVRHLKLDRAHADYGNTPRAIGGMLAANEGHDAVCFLDGDNWYGTEHVASCIALAARTDADYVTTARHMVREDGSIIALRIQEDLLGHHIDTNCYFLLRGAFHALARWILMPQPMAVFGDRVFLASLRDEGLETASTDERSVFYLCTWAHLFRAIGEPAPPYAKEPVPIGQLHRWLGGLDARQRRIVGRLSGVVAMPATAGSLQ